MRLTFFNPLLGEFKNKEEALQTMDAKFISMRGGELEGEHGIHAPLVHYRAADGAGRGESELAVELYDKNRVVNKFAMIDKDNRKWLLECMRKVETSEQGRDLRKLCG